ncbi:MAG: glycerol-3-phosphate 1-O-acyltransferase PlsY [Methyloceanibacter sp.]|uniref:glycerol-3-phosphate 1-O-acyltransferase PlsY n=1 Tax=Methyloceanibacter sp. TaxID=1965321 RepID=UPI003D6CA368
MPPSGDWSNVLPLMLGLCLVSFAIGYLLGSIPFGLILTRLAGHEDLRKIGSGNIGATNVLRTGSKGLAALTLLLDALKGTAAVMIGAQFGPYAATAAGLGAFLGHLFPVWLGFRGGKGVATYIGVALGLYWPAALAFCLVWLMVAAATRYSSLAALVASAATLGALALTSEWRIAALFLLLTVLLYARHAQNIGRLVKGEEARIGQSKQST